MIVLLETVTPSEIPIGSILYVTFPFWENNGSKARPAVVIGYHSEETIVLAMEELTKNVADDVIFAQITSVEDESKNLNWIDNYCLWLDRKYYVEEKHYLKKTSVVRCNKVAVLNDDFDYVIHGHLKLDDRKTAIDTYKLAIQRHAITDCGMALPPQ